MYGRGVDGLAEARLAGIPQDRVMGEDLPSPEVDGNLVLRGVGDSLLEFLFPPPENGRARVLVSNRTTGNGR